MIIKPIKSKDIIEEFSSRFETSDDKLTSDIKQDKPMVPLIVEGPDPNGKYYLIEGYRRFQSLKELGYNRIEGSKD